MDENPELAGAVRSLSRASFATKWRGGVAAIKVATLLHKWHPGPPPEQADPASFGLVLTDGGDPQCPPAPSSQSNGVLLALAAFAGKAPGSPSTKTAERIVHFDVGCGDGDTVDGKIGGAEDSARSKPSASSRAGSRCSSVRFGGGGDGDDTKQHSGLLKGAGSRNNNVHFGGGGGDELAHGGGGEQARGGFSGFLKTLSRAGSLSNSVHSAGGDDGLPRGRFSGLIKTLSRAGSHTSGPASVRVQQSKMSLVAKALSAFQPPGSHRPSLGSVHPVLHDDDEGRAPKNPADALLQAEDLAHLVTRNLLLRMGPKLASQGGKRGAGGPPGQAVGGVKPSGRSATSSGQHRLVAVARAAALGARMGRGGGKPLEGKVGSADGPKVDGSQSGARGESRQACGPQAANSAAGSRLGLAWSDFEAGSSFLARECGSAVPTAAAPVGGSQAAVALEEGGWAWMARAVGYDNDAQPPPPQQQVLRVRRRASLGAASVTTEQQEQQARRGSMMRSSFAGVAGELATLQPKPSSPVMENRLTTPTRARSPLSSSVAAVPPLRASRTSLDHAGSSRGLRFADDQGRHREPDSPLEFAHISLAFEVTQMFQQRQQQALTHVPTAASQPGTPQRHAVHTATKPPIPPGRKALSGPLIPLGPRPPPSSSPRPPNCRHTSSSGLFTAVLNNNSFGHQPEMVSALLCQPPPTHAAPLSDSCSLTCTG